MIDRLAGPLGVTVQQVRKYERGQDRIVASCLFDIAFLLAVPVTVFFEGLV